VAVGKPMDRSSPYHLWAGGPSSGIAGRTPCCLGMGAGWRLAVAADGEG
jgi:hypothetical protein